MVHRHLNVSIAAQRLARTWLGLQPDAATELMLGPTCPSQHWLQLSLGAADP